MKIEIFILGKTKESFIDKGVDEYLKRLKHYGKVSFRVLKQPKIPSKQKTGEEELKRREGQLILDSIPKSSFLVALDENGKQFTSTSFAKEINRWQVSGKKQISFIIGGAFGLSKEVLQRADSQISLSPMTFTHDMVRLFLVEQLYRGFTILAGEKYHKS